MCDFCTEFANAKTAKSRIIVERDGFAVMPTLGCFTDGYLLVTPRQHVPSMAGLAPVEADAGIRLAEDIRGELQGTFGAFVLAEHGALDACDMGAACCDHCHMHLIPMRGKTEAVLQRYIAVGGEAEAVGGAELFAQYHGKSYVMLSIAAGEYRFWPAEKFTRQFVRQVCAELLGIGGHYNWREHHFVDAMNRTKLVCDVLLAPQPETV